ncbi:hypothetical protein GKG47_20150 [Lactonifactor sp. BIOML-A3]|uniref:hypothetical protein n=1 Tax=unclassified Lactonifactor TaxID=2636670 RepID=UPI0012B05929|nr:MULTISPECIES: hypothetical protein [unclassified Lactonifactor]MSA03719.1 hypothetical protein [Lactonifactor sp. BIOML-A5]MSA10176.1 hypothetical protein [Lactonifactor sp. BIOML-A4]MSA14726.1 hypothetical protein [Lactonifactor sp. BIOML-A3]MSA19148.1 hypothetical protein [Lactonifactor sp. BIOML-A2]MSA39822.1 hypothetical protein [Lactonifactor sp. BIOML-A1]
MNPEEYILLDYFSSLNTEFCSFMAEGIALGTILIFITYGIFKAFSLLNIKK